jgi:hypothetical protein
VLVWISSLKFTRWELNSHNQSFSTIDLKTDVHFEGVPKAQSKGAAPISEDNHRGSKETPQAYL